MPGRHESYGRRGYRDDRHRDYDRGRRRDYDDYDDHWRDRDDRDNRYGRQDDRDREYERERARQRDRERDLERVSERSHTDCDGRTGAERGQGQQQIRGSGREEVLRKAAGVAAAAAAKEAETNEPAEAATRELAAKKAAEEVEYQRRVQQQMAEAEENDEDAEARLIEERRRRRAEIAARHSQQQQAKYVAPLKVVPSASADGFAAADLPSAAADLVSTAADLPSGGPAACAAAHQPAAPGPSASPSAASLPAPAAGVFAKASGLAHESTKSSATEQADVAMGESSTDPASASALRSTSSLRGSFSELHAMDDSREGGENGGGYDDDADAHVPLRRDDSRKLSEEAKAKEMELRKYLLDHRRRSESFAPPSKGSDAPAATVSGEVAAATTGGKGGEEPMAGNEGGDGKGEFDMFSDEVEEAAAPLEDAVDEAALMDRGDNYDDKEGYYAHRVGDVLNERYKVLGSYGKGVFSTVVRCLDMKAPVVGQEVAIKVQRNNAMMRRAGEKEIMYLNQLASSDPDNRKHCIHYIGSFDHEDHLCMIFEAMHQNLRSALRQHGHRRGIQMHAVRIYARQMFIALRYMERLNIMHADLKPDNIVVNDTYNLLKICDFGSASSGDDNEITPYLVSRFYRAPEIMMGLQYGCPIDVWAAAVSIFELYTGKIMFQGNSNNMMLKLIQEVKGKIPNKLIRKGVFAELHFDPDYDFLYKERDRVTGREIQRIIKFEQRPMLGKDLRSLLTPAKLPESEARKVMQLADLLDKALMLDPSKRITPSQALKHPFCDVSSK